MTFPDQSHINRVRDALHQRAGNGAAVMVGSGFSRNAISIHNAGDLPTWDQITNRLHEKLYPDEGDGHDSLRGGHDSLRTAQEYEAAFGRTELHNTLRQLVPHEGYNPGPAHKRLLDLPWADIYTTNWDDLLERASKIAEWDYSTVTNTDQIPMQARPRIVKLHGSLPGQFPLIVTEEDYRTYPTRFAPFVNTVQQSMMETVFFLIGFSGEDPNFLNWSGWVRDNLGASAPKIYLAGYLELSQHRRRMLEGRNVVPIDLAQHPQGSKWRDQNQHHQYATEWLLHTLETGKPYDVTNWPSLPRVKPIADEILQPIDMRSMDIPKDEEPKGKPMESPSVEEVRTITQIWRHNRLMYPGWLTMPSSNRHRMERNTSQWEDKILPSLASLTPIERLNTIRELVWRKEVLLMPMYAGLVADIEETLNAIDCENHTLEGSRAPNEDWPTIRESWRNAGAALVTAARLRLDQDSFEKWITSLEAFQNEDADIHHRIRHERCLRAIYDFNFDSLDNLLSDWQTEDCDPVWMMRKSSVLWEARREDEAEELLQRAIVTIRAMPDDESSLAGPSREAWATLVALGWDDNRQTLLRRLRDLAPFRCDVFDEQRSVLDDMGRNRPEEEPPAFDVDQRRGTSIRFSNYDPRAATYRAVRLPEVAGIPPFATTLVADVKITTPVWTGVLKEAADEMADQDLEFAIRLVLRASGSHNDKTLGRVLSRARLAALQTAQAESLAEACLRIIDKALPSEAAATLQPRTENAIEALSRLAIRLDSDLSETILDKALDLCKDPRIQKGTWATEIRHLLERTWEALPDECRHRRALDLLNAPIAGMGTEAPLMEYAWADPVELFANDDNVLKRTPNNERQWETAVDLVARALVENAAVRRRASIRMIPLVQSGLLGDDEEQKIANALWSKQHIPPDGLPANIATSDWGLLTLPEIVPGSAQKRFIAKWIPEDDKTGWQHKKSIETFGYSPNGLNHDTQDLDSCLWQVGRAMTLLRVRGGRLELSDAERSTLQEIVEIWAEAAVPEFLAHEDPFFQIVGKAHRERIRDVARVLPTITGEVGLSQQAGEKIYSKLQTLNEKQASALALATCVVRGVPNRLTEVATVLRVGMVSDEEVLAVDAVEGVRLWIEATLDPGSCVPGPPEDLVREIGISIASRRSPVLRAALATARWIFANGNQIHKEIIQQLAQDGLNYLAEEMRYDREHEAPDEVPSKRLLCVQLAAAMAQDEVDQHPAVARWLEIARDDPLPEVRNAVPEQQIESDENGDVPKDVDTCL